MPQLSAKEMAEEYGLKLTYLKSDKSLWRLFKQAVEGNWSVEKFQAKAKETSWYKKRADSRREAELLKATNPATWKQKLVQTTAQLRDAAAQMGAQLSSKGLKSMAEKALLGAWNDAQIQDALSHYVRAVNGVYKGSTGDAIADIRQAAYRNGLRVNAGTLDKYAKQIASGATTAEDIVARLRKQAAGLAPAYADQLNAGEDLWDIAQPYVQSMAQTLELNAEDIDLFDPTIRKTLYNSNVEGKPASKPLWQFERELRQDKRWLSTKNAQDSLMSVGHKVLTDMGISW